MCGQLRSWLVLYPGPGTDTATIQDLLRLSGVSDEEMVLPPEVHKITMHKLGNGRVLVSDSAGGCGIFLLFRRYACTFMQF